MIFCFIFKVIKFEKPVGIALSRLSKSTQKALQLAVGFVVRYFVIEFIQNTFIGCHAFIVSAQ